MDELQYALIGTVGGNFTMDNTGTPKINATTQQKMHPAELSVVLSAMPLANSYLKLREFVDTCGQCRNNNNLYLIAVSGWVDDFVTSYEDAVLALEGTIDVQNLVDTYSAEMSELVKIVHMMVDGATRQRGATCPMNYLEAPCTLNATLREGLVDACLRHLLRHLAHWMAHGTLHVDTGCGLFIENAAPHGKATSKRNVTVNLALIPKCFSSEFAEDVLVTGTYRSVLGSLVDHAEARDAYVALCDREDTIHEGNVNVHVIRNRVLELRAAWSGRMWTHVVKSSECGLSELLHRMRAYYLCGRGDMWLRYINDTTSIMLDPSGVAPPSMELDAYPRRLQVMFLNCLSSFQEDSYPRIKLRVDRLDYQAAGPVERAAEHILARIGSLELDCQLAVGDDSECNYSMVVDGPALRRYSELFRLHLRCMYVHEALHLCQRELLAMCKRGGSTEDARVLMPVLHMMTFFMDNFVFYLQVDVHYTLYADAQRQCNDVKSVEQAKLAHDALLKNLCERCFLTEDSATLMGTITTAMTLCAALYVVVMRAAGHDRGQQREELVYSCQQLSKKFTACMGTLYQNLNARQNMQSLLVRLDFNRWLKK